MGSFKTIHIKIQDYLIKGLSKQRVLKLIKKQYPTLPTKGLLQEIQQTKQDIILYALLSP